MSNLRYGAKYTIAYTAYRFSLVSSHANTQLYQELNQRMKCHNFSTLETIKQKKEKRKKKKGKE